MQFINEWMSEPSSLDVLYETSYIDWSVTTSQWSDEVAYRPVFAGQL